MNYNYDSSCPNYHGYTTELYNYKHNFICTIFTAALCIQFYLTNFPS